MQVTIIIPVYNAVPFLSQTVNSAIRAGAQIKGEWELILVDNNSTDGSIHILEQYQTQYPKRVKLLRAATQGAPSARNVGLAEARGEWVQFLDADDLLDDRKIADQLSLVKPTTDWVIGAYRNCWPNGLVTNHSPYQDPWKGLVYNHHLGNTNANFYRRSIIKNVGGWNESTPYYDDPNLHLRLLMHNATFLIDPEIRSTYRQHEGKSRVTNGAKAPQAKQSMELVASTVTYLSRKQPGYFEANASYFLGALLRSIRIFATYDLTAASQAYRTYFGSPKRWPLTGPYQLLPKYTRLYPYLGFRNLERLRLALAGVIPGELKRMLKS
ncbi:glycosyl transferase family 2 [Neolewinella xylanilytica]|uniref:Glycosyl transferase family 2 n=1 Tax=Neolewinella xylanilytica TaxID=1514080 RepID=A0A2S6I2U6_9BACT|nr:glycosyltransferase family A protein [Neolewinella xylanilytica]PPK85401.1 glycosyl transferase family 2 [Neolewinella xylanilytica]